MLVKKKVEQVNSQSWVNDIVSTTQSSLLAWAMRLWEALVLWLQSREEGMPNTQGRTDYDRRVCLTAWQPYDCSSSKINEVEESSEDTMLLKFFWHTKRWEPWHIEAESITLSRLNMIVNCKISTKVNPAFSRYLQPQKIPIIMVYMETKEQENWRMPWSITHVNDVRWTCRERSFSKKWTWN